MCAACGLDDDWDIVVRPDLYAYETPARTFAAFACEPVDPADEKAAGAGDREKGPE